MLKLPTLVGSKELSDLTEVWHFKPQLRPFRFVGRRGPNPGDGTAFGILLGTLLRLENFDDGVVFCWFVGGGGNLEFWFDVRFLCVFKETSLNLMFFFLLRSQGRSASCCHEPHGAQLSFVDFVSFWGTKITCRDRALPQLQRIKLQGISGHYPRLIHVRRRWIQMLQILCHGCHGIPVSHKSHNRDDHESYCGLSQSITKRV